MKIIYRIFFIFRECETSTNEDYSLDYSYIENKISESNITFEFDFMDKGKCIFIFAILWSTYLINIF